MVLRRASPALAYTDTDLVYCPACTREVGLLSDKAFLPNWTPFLPIVDRDDLPQKLCDRCDAPLGEGDQRRRRR